MSPMSDLTLSDLMNTVYGDADDRGWHDRWHHLNDADDREGIVDHTVTKLALSVTEVAESIEEVRNGKPPLYFMLDGRVVLRLCHMGAGGGVARRWLLRHGGRTHRRSYRDSGAGALPREGLDPGSKQCPPARDPWETVGRGSGAGMSRRNQRIQWEAAMNRPGPGLRRDCPRGIHLAMPHVLRVGEGLHSARHAPQPSGPTAHRDTSTRQPTPTPAPGTTWRACRQCRADDRRRRAAKLRGESGE